MQDLDREASSPQTPPARLQELANNYPRLRPLIAMNPAAYPALVAWLGSLNDPSINVALAQRGAASQQIHGPKRVSVMGREYADSATPSPVVPQEAQAPIVPQGATSSTGTEALTQPVPAKKSHSALIIAILLTVLAVAVVAFIALKVFAGPSQQDRGEGVAADTASEETAGASADTAGQDAVSPVMYPADDNALELSLFVSPSGNIACELSEDAVSCTINSYEFTGDDMQSCGAGPLTITANATEAGVNCATAAVNATGATTLSYGDYAVDGNTACRSSEYGIACWNTVSGVGFGISRGGYLIGTDGPIAPENFPWD